MVGSYNQPSHDKLRCSLLIVHVEDLDEELYSITGIISHWRAYSYSL